MIARGLAFFAVLALAPAAAAQSSPSPEAIREGEAGQAAYDAGDFATALGHFERALVLFPDPTLRYNVARCHERLGHAREAAETYRAYLADAGDLSDADRAEVEEAIRRSDAAAAAGTPATEPATPPPPGEPMRLAWPFWLSVAVAGVGVATSVAFNFVALGEQRQLGCGTYDDAAMCGTANTYTTVTVVGGVVAVIAAGAAAYLFVTEEP